MPKFCKPMPIYLLVLIVLMASGAFAEDNRTAYTVTVSGAGPDIIFVPGLASSSAVWDEAKARYGRDYRIHVLQVAGFAGAPAVGPPILDHVVEQLADYIEGERLASPTLIGHSMGGVMGMRLAIEYPGHLGRLVIVDSLPFLPAAFSPGATLETVTPRATAQRDAMLAAPRDVFLANQKRSLPIFVTGTDDLQTITEWAETSDQATVAHAVYELSTTDLRKKISDIKVPTLILIPWSEAAPYREDQARALYARQYEALPSKELVVIRNSRHFIMMDQPAAFFVALDKFLIQPVR